MPAVPEALKEGLFKALNFYSLPTFIPSEEATPQGFKSSYSGHFQPTKGWGRITRLLTLGNLRRWYEDHVYKTEPALIHCLGSQGVTHTYFECDPGCRSA
ncbi:hypothetical protein CapIbe_010849 [Capra ibex]